MSLSISKNQRSYTVESGRVCRQDLDTSHSQATKSKKTSSSTKNTPKSQCQSTASSFPNLREPKFIAALERSSFSNLSSLSKSFEENLPNQTSTTEFLKLSKSKSKSTITILKSRESIMNSSQESLNAASNTSTLNKDSHKQSTPTLEEVEPTEKSESKSTVSQDVLQEPDSKERSSSPISFSLAPPPSDDIQTNSSCDNKDSIDNITTTDSQDSKLSSPKTDSPDQGSDKNEGRQTRERSFERSLDNIMDKCSEKSLDLNLSVDSWNGSVSDTSLRTPDSSYVKFSKGEKKRTKKSSWYTMLSPTYKSRSEDFHKLFKDVPKDERLVVDYSCALQKDILVQGRMYISQNWICFYANIFRWETVLCIPCSDITAITKEKTARVIPNAIQVTTEKEKYFFTSFGARDKTYMMLFRLWQNALLAEPMNPKEQWQWIHYSYGEELGLTSSDEDYVAPPGMDDIREKLTPVEMPALKENTDSSDVHGPPEALAMVSNDEDAIQSDEVFSQTSPSLDSPLSINRLEIPTDYGDTTDDSEGEVACSGHDHLEKLYVDEVFNINVDKMFTLLFTDTPFFRIFVESRKTFDVDIPIWGEEVDDDGNRVRTLHYTLSLNHSIGPKTSPSSERQTCYKQSKPGIIYVVDCQCENGGIPYADSFFVITQYCLTRVTKDKCRLRVTGEVKYKKSVMGIVKSMIERSAVSGLTDYFRDLAAHLRREVQENDKTLVHTISKKKLRKRRKPIASASEPLSSARQTDRQNGAPPSPLRTGVKDDQSVLLTADTLVRIICVILLMLAMCNAVLYYKLWSLESYATGFYQPNSQHIFENKNYPHSKEEWVRLLQQQQYLHDSEIDKWREVLSASIVLVDQMKGTLVNLHDSLEGRLNSNKQQSSTKS